MTLGYALLIIFVLYLIDKHNRWRQAVKTAIALIVAAAVLWGVDYGFVAYSGSGWKLNRYMRNVEKCVQQNGGDHAVKPGWSSVREYCDYIEAK